MNNSDWIKIKKPNELTIQTLKKLYNYLKKLINSLRRKHKEFWLFINILLIGYRILIRIMNFSLRFSTLKFTETSK